MYRLNADLDLNCYCYYLKKANLLFGWRDLISCPRHMRDQVWGEGWMKYSAAKYKRRVSTYKKRFPTIIQEKVKEEWKEEENYTAE